MSQCIKKPCMIQSLVMSNVITSSDQLIEKLLINRGIKTDKQKDRFFNPKLEDYESEFNLTGIEKAKKRILEAKEKNELVIVFGDYDADGICATAIMYHSL